ncbi:hypothetical protein GCK72_025425 [Caenorhabditis remanei]|nr:hypothetical protein GCK72_025425 [Caenorhabditis remanei]KAF1748958.1 hypothetical protein GCK72_025425 [Caenorhabditis remanei]
MSSYEQIPGEVHTTQPQPQSPFETFQQEEPEPPKETRFYCIPVCICVEIMACCAEICMGIFNCPRGRANF